MKDSENNATKYESASIIFKTTRDSDGPHACACKPLPIHAKMPWPRANTTEVFAEARERMAIQLKEGTNARRRQCGVQR